MKKVFIDGVGNDPSFVNYYVIPFCLILITAYTLSQLTNFLEKRKSRRSV